MFLRVNQIKNFVEIFKKSSKNESIIRNFKMFLLKAYLRHVGHYIEVLMMSKPQVIIIIIVMNNILLTVP